MTTTDSIFNLKKPKEVKEVLQVEATLGPAKDDLFYNMNHPKRGIALVFCHAKFKSSRSSRTGSHVDEKAITEQLNNIGFTVENYNDLSRAEIMQNLNRVATMDHTNADCLVVVVMTHGDAKELAAHDESYATSKIWEPFTGKKCPSLVGKPKLFFIQACRGEGVDSGVKIQPTPRSALRTKMDSEPSRPLVTYTIPNTADMLIAYATYDGQYAWRSPQTGSWFIQALSSELKEHAFDMDILQILTLVNKRVATDYASYNPGDKLMNAKKQMPNFMSTLIRFLRFTKKEQIQS